jgi:hypothetical protein
MWGKVGECGEVGKVPGDAGIIVLMCGRLVTSLMK